MMRSLWTAATGMKAQQINTDTIANNLANVNTTGFKNMKVEFKDLMYETLSKASLITDNAAQMGRPVNLQVGHGAIPVATSTNFSTGNFQNTNNPLDVAIDGEGFFIVGLPDGAGGYREVYTRDGSFKISVNGTEGTLVTAEGYPILDGIGGSPIEAIDLSERNIDKIIIAPDGAISYIEADNTVSDIGRIGLARFPNKEGLSRSGSNFYEATPAAGEIQEDTQSMLRQNFLESSNVQIVDEMVRLIIAQRAYEINSKAVTTSDEMLSTANNLKR